MNAAAAHPFQTQPSVARRSEAAIFWLFRGATYFVLLCGAVVFLNIFIKGSRTVFQTKAPFVNTAFFTESPESLYVFEWQGKKMELGDKEFRAFKEQNPAVQVWAIEPPTGEMVDGLRNLDDGYIPPIFADLGGAEILDRKTVVRPRESIEWTRRMTELGLFVGISSGAIMAGAIRCASQIPEGQEATIVTIACDDGWKYLSTGAWTEDIDTVVDRASKVIYF